MKKTIILTLVFLCLLTIGPLMVLDCHGAETELVMTENAKAAEVVFEPEMSESKASPEPARKDEVEATESKQPAETAGDSSQTSIENTVPEVSGQGNENNVGGTDCFEESTQTTVQTSDAQALDKNLGLIVDENGYISMTPFSADHYMVGLFSEISEGFNTGEWDITDAQLTLSFSTTQLVSEVLSNITISINGVRFYSENVPVTDGTRRELTVKIPVEHIVEGYNVIAIEGYIRTYNGLPCVDDVTTANWMNVFKESFIEISYHPVEPCANIDDFYSCFTSINALENDQSAVAIATGYDTDELDAALTTLAGISRKSTKSYQNINFIACDECSHAGELKYVIYIGKPDHLPEMLQSAVSENGGLQGSDAGMFLITGDINVLVVTGNDGAALDRAAALLSDPTTMNQLKKKVKIIDENEDVYVRKEGIKQYTQLTKTGTYVDGAFRQKADYQIDFENNRKLAYGSEVDLYFRYSKNLDFERSLVTVYVNDVPIGSQKLSMAKAEGDNIVLNIPTDIEVAGSFKMTVAFDLEIKDLWCTLRQSETPWAYVSSESMLKLNSVEVPYYLFENYPYPFLSGGELNDVVLVVPDDNSDLDLNLMGNFMLTMGQFLKYNTGDLSVVRASNPGGLQEKNVIAVGTYSNNPFIAGLNDQLFFRFYENGAGIMSNEKLLIEPTYSTTLSTAQIIQSPYSNVKNAILVLASANADYLKNTFEYFGDTTELWKLYGDGFVADEDDIFQYRFKEENEKEEQATEEFFERADVMNLIYVAGAVLVILLAAVIFMVMRYRRRHSHEEKK